VEKLGYEIFSLQGLLNCLAQTTYLWRVRLTEKLNFFLYACDMYVNTLSLCLHLQLRCLCSVFGLSVRGFKGSFESMLDVDPRLARNVAVVQRIGFPDVIMPGN
jgi:hypothetical protein